MYFKDGESAHNVSIKSFRDRPAWAKSLRYQNMILPWLSPHQTLYQYLILTIIRISQIYGLTYPSTLKMFQLYLSPNLSLTCQLSYQFHHRTTPAVPRQCSGVCFECNMDHRHSTIHQLSELYPVYSHSSHKSLIIIISRPFYLLQQSVLSFSSFSYSFLFLMSFLKPMNSRSKKPNLEFFSVSKISQCQLIQFLVKDLKIVTSKILSAWLFLLNFVYFR